jgi:hypothetical protein
MYFNHAFRKSFLAKWIEPIPAAPGPQELAPVGSVIDQLTSGTTADLQPGQIGLFDANTYQAINPSGPNPTNSGKPFILAQGSYFTKDKIGPYHGGYQESVKSKVINPKYISKVFLTCSTPPVNQVKDIEIGKVECGKTYRLRLDLKGSPALRFLSHNIYRTLDAFTGCCTDDCTATCTGAIVDPTIVAIKWAKQSIENPILTNFLKVSVNDSNGDLVGSYDPEYTGEDPLIQNTVSGFVALVDQYPVDTETDFNDCDLKAKVTFEVAYLETKFGYCTFTPTDFYELQPLELYASVVDESGDPCNVQCVSITGTWNNGVYTPDVQEPVQAQGVGETVLRNLILDGRYRQEAYPDSSRVDHLRMREIEANPVLATVDRNSFFNSINILHSVPRFNNPTGTFDNDQYLLTIYLEEGANATTFINQLQAILNNCCPGLQIEQYCAGAEGAAPAPAQPFGDGGYPNYGNCACSLVTAAVPAIPNTETTTVSQG